MIMRLSKLILSSVKLAVSAAITAAFILSFSPSAPRAAASQDQESADVALLSEDDLFELVGPIALYPVDSDFSHRRECVY